MDDKIFKEYKSRLLEANAVIEKLDPAIRSEAFKLLTPYVVAHAKHAPASVDQLPSDLTSFFERNTGKKPADNALIVAAYLYGQYGSMGFSLEEIRQLATDVGLTIPDRLDVTIAGAKRKGKQLFRRVSIGHYRPTVHGEKFFQTQYKVSKGTKTRPVDRSE